jgi:DNA-binding beta-propeller fold protein YncE
MSARLLIVAAALGLAGPAQAAPAPRYALAATWTAPDAAWDYASVDATARRLYVGRFGGVLAVDLETGAVSSNLFKSSLVHGVAPLTGGLAAASNGDDDTVAIFDGRSGDVVATIPAGKGPDSIVLDPWSGLLAVTDEDGGQISLIDPVKRRPAGTIAIGGAPEAVTSDHHGLLYNSVDDRAEVAVISVAKRKVVGRIKLPGCDRPTGIAYDTAREVVISACRNGAVNLISGKTRRVTTTLMLGAGPDTVMVDPARGVAFVPSGATGELNVIAIGADGKGALVERVPSQVGSRTGAVDPVTGDVYLPAAKLLPSTTPGQPHALEPGSFRILVFSPR